jgi:dTDP-4-dehydrorhamnose reductase
MIKVAVTGMDGQIGRCLQEIADITNNVRFHFFNRDSWDLSEPNSSQRLLDDSFHFLINTAAYTAVDKAESEADICYQVNVDGVKNLVRTCNDQNIHLIHFSSDYVYHNDHLRPCRENDECLAKGVYATSKLDADQWIMAHSKSATIIRSSWIYSEYGHNFVKTMLKLATTKSEINVVQDQWGCPTSAHDLSHVIVEMISLDLINTGKTAVLNYTQRGCTNWYEIALEIMRYTRSSTRINPIATSMYPTDALRPKNSMLNCDAFDTTVGLTRRYWKDALYSCIDRLQP